MPSATIAPRDRRLVILLPAGARTLIGTTDTDWAAADGITLLMRIAMTEPGRGHGRPFLRGLIGRVFTETNCHRFWLGQFPDNARARHVYESLGFVAEGVARGSVFLFGEHRDELILSILRPDWIASSRV